LDHAVFTSVRSVTGQGYRLVSRTSGLRESEVRELVRCAPSHASLEDESASGRGLAAARFPEGRWAVLCVQAAGPEPSNRGGMRIFTHALFLDAAAYTAFENDPFRVADARPQGELDALLARLPAARIPPLVLRVPETLDAFKPGEESDSDAGRLRALAALLHPERRLVVRGAPRDAARRLVARLAPERRLLSISWGIRCAPSRPFALQFAEPALGEIRRLTADGETRVVEWNALAAPAEEKTPRTECDGDAAESRDR